MSPAQFISQEVFKQLSTDPMDSKKLLAAMGGGTSLLIFFIVSAVLYCMNPKDFGAFSTVATMAITAAAGLSSAYITGQAAVEFKANAVLKAQAEALPPVGVAPTPPVVTTVKPSAKVDNPDA